jgi:PPK2 family polyphosphate:nucleotide phosphotransferase
MPAICNQKGRHPVKIDLEHFRVSGDEKVRLKKWATDVEPLYSSEKEYKELLAADVHDLGELQRLLYASNSHSVLLVFQAMDAAGKDGAISHVLSGINPQGCDVHSFKHPSAEELDHDFLWRTTRSLPQRGRIGVFNRSYYEEVLIVRVHPEIWRREGIPGAQVATKKDWKGRYRSIVELEKHLHRNGTVILKFFLHLSKEEQRKRFLQRIDDPDKNWKFSEADIAERGFWDQYMKAYEACLSATSTKTAPWYVVPADDKYNARLIISAAVIAALKNLDMRFPETTPQRRSELQAIRRQLEK